MAVSDTRGTKRKKSKQAMDEFTLFLYIFVASGTRDTISKNMKCVSEYLVLLTFMMLPLYGGYGLEAL